LPIEVYLNAALPNPYDVALRERAVQAYERGEGSYADLTALFQVDHRTLERWVARWRATGSVAPRPRGGGWACPIDMEVLLAVVRETPDGTLEELCRLYNRRVPRACCSTRASVHRALQREDFVLKKNARGPQRSIGRMWQRNASRS
jgi:transposase